MYKVKYINYNMERNEEEIIEEEYYGYEEEGSFTWVYSSEYNERFDLPSKIIPTKYVYLIENI